MPGTDSQGTVTVEGDVATITFVRRLPYRIDAVWQSLYNCAPSAGSMPGLRIADR